MKLDIIGKGLREVNEIVTEAGCTFRVVSRDGERYVVTMDHHKDRVNLTLVEGKVTGYTFG